MHPRRLKPSLTLIWLPLFAALTATAQVPLPGAVTLFDGTYRSQSVTVSVASINLVAVSGGASLTISTATAGASPDADTDATTTYDITVNGSDKKLTGALDIAYDAGLTLKVQLQAPTGASSSQKTLSTTAVDLVTGITRLAASDLTITYECSAAASVASNGSGQSRTVTLTLTDG